MSKNRSPRLGETAMERLAGWLEGRVPVSHVPKRWSVVQSIDRTELGKRRA